MLTDTMNTPSEPTHANGKPNQTVNAPKGIAPPPIGLTLKEVTAPLDWLGTLVSKPTLRKLPKGDQRPVLLAPGFLTDSWSMRPLRDFLRRLNYVALDWELGRNMGHVDDDIIKFGHQVGELASATGEPVTLIGWSLGGTISREVARFFPECVREVITLGTPVTGGPKYTSVGARMAKIRNINLDTLEQEVLERNRQGFEQPVTVIYSKKDGVVSWKASIDVYNAQAKHIEVNSTHLGIGVHADSWKAIALILAGQTERLPWQTGEQALQQK